MEDILLECHEGQFFVSDKKQSLNKREICNPWDVLSENSQLSSLHCTNVMQYLTSMEADLAMLNWMDALEIGGQLTVKVPNTDYFIKLWQRANWSNDDIINAESVARKAFEGIWGPQQAGNPRNNIYSESKQGVFKSGYNAKRLELLFHRAGLTEVEVRTDRDSLIASAMKTMNRGERQISTNYSQIRPDHKARYQFACDYLRGKGCKRILDLACGIGYGSKMLAEQTNAFVTGVDVDNGAILHARKYFHHQCVEFQCEDAKYIDCDAGSFDAIVSFETIEHIDFDKKLIQKFYELLKPGGRLFASTPNQNLMPYDSSLFPYHVKHYTKEELTLLLSGAAFLNIELYTQINQKSDKIESGDHGHFFVAIATK